MVINTTLNVHSDILIKLSRGVSSLHKSKTYMISSLLRRLADDFVKFEKSWVRIKYQNRGARENWRCVHVYLKPDEYEFFLDLRKVFKFSLSHLVAIAVDLYIDELIDKASRGTDNYRYRNYMSSRIIIDGVVCWMHYWGIPISLITLQH